MYWKKLKRYSHSSLLSILLPTDEVAPLWFRQTTNPHTLLILYKILLLRAQRSPSFPRALRKWQPLFPLFMDHILVEIDNDAAHYYSAIGVGVPIESRLRLLAVSLLYEVCRVQRIDTGDLRKGLFVHLVNLFRSLSCFCRTLHG